MIISNKLIGKLEKLFAIVALTAIGFSIACILYWQTVKIEPPVKFYSLPHHQYVVDPNTNIIVVDRVYCATKTIDVIAKRTIRDGINYSMDDYHATLKKGCVKRTTYLQIPILPPGYYVFDSTIVLPVNPLKTIEISLQPVQFVIPDKDGNIPKFSKNQKEHVTVDKQSATNYKDVPISKEEVNNIISKGQ